MRSSLCLRLARQSALSQQCVARRTVGSTRIDSSRSWDMVPISTLSRHASRALSSGPDIPNKTSRFAVVQDANEAALSPFKQHRRDELRKDHESEDPLYPDPYPRSESADSRKSVPEFLEELHEQVPSEEVTLAGRVRSKRVVGKGLVFLDIVNEFQKVQIMINKNKCVSEKQGRIQKFSLFRNLIQIGDHICRASSTGFILVASRQSG